MKPKERASSREPSHTPKFIRTAVIVLAVVLLLIVLAKLVAFKKLLGLE